MAQVLIAATDDGIASVKRILGSEHDFFVVKTIAEAVGKLKETEFDLTIVDVHFDESRMFELLREYRQISKNSENPIVCICTPDTALTRTMHAGVEITSKALGAWMYIDQYEFKVTKNPDAEVRRLIERCLTGEARKKTHEARAEIHKQREEFQRLREELQRQEWSEELQERVVKLRRNLAETMLDLCESHLDTVTQQESIAHSEEKKDRVSASVQLAEAGATRQERQLMTSETNQTVKELKLGEREETKRTKGRDEAKANVQTSSSSPIALIGES